MDEVQDPKMAIMVEMMVKEYVKDGTALCYNSYGGASTRKAPKCQADVEILGLEGVILLYMNKKDMDTYIENGLQGRPPMKLSIKD